jgi:small subunit ribosomal protein S29
MASSGCWKCLARPAAPFASPLAFRPPPPQHTAAFSTTAARPNVPVKTKKISPAMHAQNMKLKAKGTKTLKIKKKIPVKTGKPPMPGERKAMRKRIVLSNTNALEVQGLQDLDKEMVVDGALVAKVVGLPGAVVDSLRSVEAFKVTQGWGLFRRPCLLVRKESVLLSRKMVDTEQSKEAIRMLLDGARGSGKSLMLLHAMATAFVRGWIVVSIPDGKSIPVVHSAAY